MLHRFASGLGYLLAWAFVAATMRLFSVRREPVNSITRTSSRRSVMKWAAALGAATALPVVGGFRGYPALAQDDAVWETEPDTALAAEQAQEIVTYGMPDDWANYGEVFKNFQASLSITDGKHTDTDMTSLEEITK